MSTINTLGHGAYYMCFRRIKDKIDKIFFKRIWLLSATIFLQNYYDSKAIWNLTFMVMLLVITPTIIG